ncbi:MAG: hypothetical protein ACRDCE_01525 [Cetobacterium sp.]|uniref:hypothetical protein n=1 Tax=Cetobacterium sp. TaxID=2071632 RepID=UPI003EE64BCD
MEIITKQLTGKAAIRTYSVSNENGGTVWNQLGERLTISESKTKGKFVTIKGKRYYISDLLGDNY